jgi:hypothetical protein
MSMSPTLRNTVDILKAALNAACPPGCSHDGGCGTPEQIAAYRAGLALLRAAAEPEACDCNAAPGMHDGLCSAGLGPVKAAEPEATQASALAAMRERLADGTVRRHAEEAARKADPSPSCYCDAPEEQTSGPVHRKADGPEAKAKPIHVSYRCESCGYLAHLLIEDRDAQDIERDRQERLRRAAFDLPMDKP